MKAVLGLSAIAVGVFCLAGLSQEPPTVTVGKYTTSLQGRDSNQRHNAMLCLGKIDGAVIKPGEVFSFNDLVGPWSRDQGYRRAPVSYSGQMIDAWGGGVCQSSTTVYNASLLAGLEIVERGSHHYAPTYVQPGRDAAVAFPNIDLKVRNPYDVPLTLKASIVNGQIVTEWSGQVQNKRESEINVRLIAAHRPQEIEVGRGGTRLVRNIGKPGFEVEVFRTLDGQRQLLSRDTYEVMNRVVEHSPRQ